jgi:hypothetical protein
MLDKLTQSQLQPRVAKKLKKLQRLLPLEKSQKPPALA